MQLYHAISSAGNFGDDMNTWFWDALLKDWRVAEPDVTLFGIGTILGSRILQRHDRVLVCGSGAGYGGLGAIDRGRVEISWVRGPRTAALIGLDPRDAITDPACMVTTMPEFSDLPAGTGGTIFIPHRSTARLDLNWDRIGRQAGLRVVLPSGDAHAVIADIAGADLVVTESMHGAIFADAFRVPWVAVRISNEFNDFKWMDWAGSVEVELRMHEALRIPKAAWSLARTVRQKVAALKGASKPAPPNTIPNRAPAASGPIAALPGDLGDDGRQRIKRLAGTLAPVLETMLARDLKRAKLSSPQLSRDGVVQDRIARIQGRLETIQSRIDRALDPA